MPEPSERNRSPRRVQLTAVRAALAAVVTVSLVAFAGGGIANGGRAPKVAGARVPAAPTASKVVAAGGALSGVDHVVVIYEENHSFDNLWGRWPGVNGLAANPADTPNNQQIAADGTRFNCLLQNDVNLTTSADPPPNGGLAPSCSTFPAYPYNSAFLNQPFKIDDTIPATATTCYTPTPAAPFGPSRGVKNGTGAPGGCTEDLVHRFYQEQYQINGGRMDRYTTGSDAVGLTQGYYDTTKLPLYQYLTGDPSAPNYAIADNFFAGAFGGSFLNHQWLVAAQTPKWEGGAVRDGSANDLHSIVGPDGSPANYPLHMTAGLKDAQLTEVADINGVCAPPAGAPAPPPGTKCGDYAVNTIQPSSQPFAPGTSAAKKLPLLHSGNIGDELSAANVTWNWYSGGWDNAAGVVGGTGWTNGSGPTCSDPNTPTTATYPYCPNLLFQYHHQPLNYFANYAEGAPGRSHLKDETDFLASARAGTLPAVSFLKPLGPENSHPGYGSEANGDRHLVDLIKAIKAGPDWAHTAIVVTYDEFGGSWDHVPPPTSGDGWGPGTRLPAMVISPLLPHRWSVDHTRYDTTSILATIERRFGLAPLSSRDGQANALTAPFTFASAPFVKAAYQDFLGRPPTDQELFMTVAGLDAGSISRGQVVDQLARSQEWIGAIVDGLYRDTLGRPADSAGRAYWIDQIRSGRMSVAVVAASFRSSDEYYATKGGGTDQGWVTELYRSLLGREPDQNGLAYWTARARYERGQVAYEFFQSPESRGHRVDQLYRTLLGRSADAGGLAYWTDRILVEGDVRLAVLLAASVEYADRASLRFG